MTPEILKNLSMELLIETWEQVDKMEVTVDVANIRGWLMNELERRNTESFEKWVDDEFEQEKTISPKNYFL